MFKTLGPRSNSVLFLTGWLLLILASFSSALASVQQVDPFYLKAMADGEKAFAAGDFQSAAQSFEIAAFGLYNDKNALTKAWAYLCLAHYKAGQIEKSHEAAQKLEELMGPADLSSIGLKAEVASDVDKLMKFFKEYLQTRGFSPGVQTRVLPTGQAVKEGSGSVENKMALEREKSLKDGLKADPRNASLYLDLYDFYAIQKKSKEARDVLEKLVDKVPQEPRGHYLLGKAFYAQRKYNEAQRHFENVLRLTEKKPVVGAMPLTSRGYLILCLNFLNRKKDLAKQCEEFTQAVPDVNIEAWDMSENDKALLKDFLARYKTTPAEKKTGLQAEDQVGTAKTTQPRPSGQIAEAPPAKAAKEVALAYGVYDQYLQAKDRASARRTLQSLLKKFPQEVRAQFLLARMDYQDKQYKEAGKAFSTLLEVSLSGENREGYKAEAAAYLVLCTETLQGRQTAMSLAQAHRDLLGGAVLDNLSLDGSDKQKVRDLLEGGTDAAAGARILREIRVHKTDDSLRVEILYSPPTTYRTFVLQNERKIILDLFNVSEVRSDRIIPVNSLGLQSIRSGMFEEKTARIVLDARGEIPPYDIQTTSSGLVIIVGQAPAGPAGPSI
jgi:tetratricopeptide (TPR) repeat protein